MSSWVAGPQWGVSSGVKLQSQLSYESVNNFDQTIRPFEQRTRQTKQRTRQSQGLAKQSQRPLQRSSVQEPRSSQRSRQPQPHSQDHSRPSQQIQQHVAAPRRSLRLSQLSSRSLEPTLRSSQRNHPSQPLKPVSNHRTSISLTRQPPRPWQQVPTGLPSLPRERFAGSRDSPVALSPTRPRDIMTRLNASVQEIMSSMLPDKPSNLQWKSKLRKKSIEYYVDETSIKPGHTRFCCVSHTHATVDEVMNLFLPTDKDSLLRNNRMLYDNLLESRVLSVLREPTKERPMNSMYVRYSSFHTPGPLANREMCVAVATDMIRQSDGSTIGYCLWDSVDDSEFAQAARKPGFEPCTMFRSGFFVRHSGRRDPTNEDPMQGQTKIVYMVGMESSLPTRLLMEKYGSTLNRLCAHLRRKHLDPSTFVTKSEWESKMAARSCKQCDKPFQVLSCRVNCHACGHVVCRSCASKESVELQTVGLVSINLCFWCLEKAGLPAPESAQKIRASLRQRRLHSETASTFRQSIAVVYADMDDDDDTDSGEWAITTLGVPVRPPRMAACV